MSKAKLVSESGLEVMCTENIQDLTASLVSAYDQLRAGIIDNSTAKAHAHLAGTILGAIRTTIVYNNMIGTDKEIAFMGSPKQIKK